MEQLQQGFSDSTPKAGSDRLQKYLPVGGRLRNRSDQLGPVRPENLKITFLLNSKE